MFSSLYRFGDDFKMSNFSAFRLDCRSKISHKKTFRKQTLQKWQPAANIKLIFFIYLSLQFSSPYDGSIKNIILSKNELVLIVVTSCKSKIFTFVV